MEKIVWTPLALDDLRVIHNFIANDSFVYADKLIERIFNRIEQLENFPHSGRVVPEFGSESIRELIEGNYRIVYQITGNQVNIIRIHHSAQQLK